MILHIQTRYHYSFPILENGFSSLYHVYSNSGDRLQNQYYLSKSSSPPLPGHNYLQSQASNLHTIVETEVKISPKPPLIKRILVADDDPDIQLAFKTGLDGVYYGGGDEKKSIDGYTYNEPSLVVEEFNPYFYDLRLTDVYMPSKSGFQLFEKI